MYTQSRFSSLRYKKVEPRLPLLSSTLVGNKKRKKKKRNVSPYQRPVTSLYRKRKKTVRNNALPAVQYPPLTLYRFVTDDLSKSLNYGERYHNFPSRYPTFKNNIYSRKPKFYVQNSIGGSRTYKKRKKKRRVRRRKKKPVKVKEKPEYMIPEIPKKEDTPAAPKEVPTRQVILERKKEQAIVASPKKKYESMKFSPPNNQNLLRRGRKLRSRQGTTMTSTGRPRSALSYFARGRTNFVLPGVGNGPDLPLSSLRNRNTNNSGSYRQKIRNTARVYGVRLGWKNRKELRKNADRETPNIIRRRTSEAERRKKNKGGSDITDTKIDKKKGNKVPVVSAENLRRYKFGEQDDSYEDYSQVDLDIDIITYKRFVSTTMNRYRQVDLLQKIIKHIPNDSSRDEYTKKYKNWSPKRQ